ncbi:hypothetical protein ATL17_1606 [Maritalea mobilis]|uniref:Uncharacterized protein n=1 Tax=Maritalea mobilis TaxID=483324 RepID=A0A4R6VJ30_9HYPH|nr:hypothetical protein [Maritalea mobilis]TDQ63599.1 hypothetical protein ATL17_1606 [Maritalea mobilis]
MYYFKEHRFNLWLLMKSNGIPMYLNGKRISDEKIVMWFPLNWLVLLVMVMILPFCMIWDDVIDPLIKRGLGK